AQFGVSRPFAERPKRLSMGHQFTTGRVMMDGTYRVTHTDAEWRQRLTPEQYEVMRGHATERPGSCALLHEKRPGTFSCAGCDTPLFEGKVKFESGTGWPSFNEPVPGSV